VRWIQAFPDDAAPLLVAPPWMTITDPQRYLAALRRDAALGASSPRAAGLLRDLDVASRSPDSGWRRFNQDLIADLIERASGHADLEEIGAYVRDLVERDDLGATETRQLVGQWKERWAEIIRVAAPSVPPPSIEHDQVAADTREPDQLEIEPRHGT
jgi:hypothetical protein